MDGQDKEHVETLADETPLEWVDPASSLVIRLGAMALATLESQFEQLKRSPHTGVLLGCRTSENPGSITVEDCQPISGAALTTARSSPAPPPAELLSEFTEFWQPAFDVPLTVVGYYTIRPEPSSTLPREDAKMFEEHFAEPATLAIAITPGSVPGTAMASVFLRERGALWARQPVVQAPMPWGDVASLPVSGSAPSQAAAAPGVPLAPAPNVTDLVPVPSRKSMQQNAPPGPLVRSGTEMPARWQRERLAFAGGLVLLLSALPVAWHYGAANSRREQSPFTGGELQPRVQHSDGFLRVGWTPSPRWISGVMDVQDGSYHQRIALTSTDLGRGTLLYSPRTQDVTFVLSTLSLKGESKEESVRVIGAEEASSNIVRPAAAEPAVAEPVVTTRSSLPAQLPPEPSLLKEVEPPPVRGPLEQPRFALPLSSVRNLPSPPEVAVWYPAPSTDATGAQSSTARPAGTGKGQNQRGARLEHPALPNPR